MASSSGRLISQLSHSQPRGAQSNTAAVSPQRLDYDEPSGTLSSFAPDHESTQQFDTATQEQLPNLRSSASRFASRRTPETAPAYPDLTATSPVPDMSESIELGRGVKRSARNSPAKGYEHEEISESLALDLGHASLYDFVGAPPMRSGSKTLDGNLRKEASLRRATSAPRVEKATRTTSTSNRRTLSDMHAKVYADSDSSFIVDDRLHSAANTRFSRQSSAADRGIPTRFTSGRGLDSRLDQTPRPSARNVTADSATYTGNQTQQSFMLPDLPNITELVSGLRKDGTPVFSRSAKSRSRFTSGSYGKPNDYSNHAQIHSVPVPEEEKAIFASLQLLKDKVEQLEAEKSEAVKRLEEYETEVIDLRSNLQMEQKLRRPDSALGSDEEGSARDKWRVEKSKLQASMKSAQDRLDRSDRKVSVSEIAAKRMTQERDNLVTQLGVAYYHTEELKIENEQLQSENDSLQQDNDDLQAGTEALRKSLSEACVKIAGLKSQQEDDSSHWTKREAELKNRIERREDAVREMRDFTREIWDVKKSGNQSVQPGEPQEKSGKSRDRKSSGRLGNETQDLITNRIEQEIRKARVDAANKAASIAPKLGSKLRTRENAEQANRRTSAPRNARPLAVQADASDWESTTELELGRPTRRGLREVSTSKGAMPAGEEDSKDVTYLSFLDPNELSKLRRQLEEERRAAKRARSAAAPSTKDILRATDGQTQTQTHPMRRKSSLRDITANVPDLTNEDAARLLKNVRIQSPHTSDAISYDEPLGTADISMLSTASRRPRSKSFEETTSAFILPDITMHNKALPTAAQLAQATGVQHDKQGCTFCPGHAEAEAEKQAIPTPVPVTDRDIDETNATIRPSQSPPNALATVLKQLEDEVTHLKLQLAAFERAYGAHDPSLGRRKRTALKEKINALIMEVEKRSDQIYALYDVLEGQKSGVSASIRAVREEAEETLQSLGIDVEELARRAAESKTGKARKASIGLVDDGQDELLLSDDGSDGEGLGVAGTVRRRSVVV